LSDSNIHIIAEAGTNNNGDFAKAKTLVEIANNAGADSVKFQIINPWGLYRKGEYKYGHYDIKEVIKIREDGMMTDQEYSDLNAFASQQGIPFTASVFDEKGLDLLDSFDPPYIKIASCDLNNIRFLKQVAERKRRMIISTGMSTLSEVENSLNELAKSNFSDIILLHCVSIYPATLDQANLPFIKTLIDNFGFPVGFSDHTGTSHAACVALAVGATYFEKHFTADKTQKGFDHAYAMEEKGLTDYVSDLRMAEKAMQQNTSKLTDKELYTKERARRSLYASKNLKAGQIISDEDVLIVRPENILRADEITLLIGKTLTKDLPANMPFSKDIIS